MVVKYFLDSRIQSAEDVLMRRQHQVNVQILALLNPERSIIAILAPATIIASGMVADPIILRVFNV